MEKAASQPNSLSEGRSESTVTASPHASTTDVRISAGPTRTVARFTPMAEELVAAETGLVSDLGGAPSMVIDRAGWIDANNLGWKLAFVANGWSSDALLDSYSDERVAAARRVLGR